jgi:hypothetical protein
VVNVSNRSYVHMRFCPLELFLRHFLTEAPFEILLNDDMQKQGIKTCSSRPLCLIIEQ